MACVKAICPIGVTECLEIDRAITSKVKFEIFRALEVMHQSDSHTPMFKGITIKVLGKLLDCIGNVGVG